MKCPYRTVETFSKTQNAMEHQPLGGFVQYSGVVPCSEADAQMKTIDFADCLEFECGAWRYGKNGGYPQCRRNG